MSKRIIFIIALLAFAAFEGFYYTKNLKRTAADIDYQKAFRHSNKIFSLVLPDKAEFAGEEAPLGLYYVREGLDRELMVNTYWHSSTMLMLKKIEQVFSYYRTDFKEAWYPRRF